MGGELINLVPGKTFARLVNLYKGKQSFDMTGAVCKVRVVTADRKTALSQEVTIVSGVSGDDWTASKIGLIIPASDTQAITQFGAAFVEIHVKQNGIDDHWWLGVQLVKGHTV